MNKLRWFAGICIILILLLSSSTVALADTNQAVSYLDSVQQVNGSWSTDLSTTFFETTTVLDTLNDMGKTGDSYVRGINYVAGQSVSGVEDNARKVTALAPAGRDMSNELNFLLDARNPDGGWGFDKGYASDVYHTTLVLYALRAAGVTDPNIISTTLGYIAYHQNANRRRKGK